MIREAEEHDIPMLLKMGARFHEASGFIEMPFDAASLEGTLRSLIESEDGVVLIGDGGMAGVLVYPCYFNHTQRQAQELFWWVDQDKRSTGLGRALLEGVEAWAKERGASTLTMICLDALDGERVSSLYRRAGYRPSERNFLKRL